MHFTTLVFSQFLLPVLGQSTFSKSVCITKYGSKSVGLPLPSSSTTKIATFSALRMTWIVPSVTITPKPKTTTTTVDVTSTITSEAPKETDTFHTTITIDTTLTTSLTETAITTQVDTSTVTLPAPTVTVTTAAGWVPIQSVPGNLPLKVRAEGHARRIAEAAVTPVAAFETREEKKLDLDCEFRDGKATFKGRYPTGVVCENNIKVINTKTLTFTWWKTATMTAPRPTITSTITRFHTTTTILTPIKASTTISDFTTNTFSATTTTTTSSISTLVATATVSSAATATAYPGCSDPGNYLSTKNGNGIKGGSFTFGVSNTIKGRMVESKEACCQACFDTPNCLMTTYKDGNCFYYYGEVCTPANVVYQYVTEAGLAPDFTFSNGPCGLVKSF